MTLSPHPLIQAEHALTHSERAELTERLAWRAFRTTDVAERHAVHQQIIHLNIRVARAVAARYRGGNIPLEDLEQVACEGLIKAVHRFDPCRDRDLLSYAVPTIRGEVLRHFRDHGWTVRPPRRVQELQGQITAASAQLGSALRRLPTADEICIELRIARSEYDDVVQAARRCRCASLEELMAGSGVEMGATLADTTDRLAAAEARAILRPVLRHLSERDRQILHLRFVEDRTQQEIGLTLAVSQAQVSRRLTRILDELRLHLVSGDWSGYASGCARRN